MVPNEIFDLLIIGGGPSGLTAAIYAARLGMKTLLLDGGLLGGRAAEAPVVENFPGFPEGISGAELIARMIRQAEKFGAEIRYPEEVVDILLKDRVKTVVTERNRYHSIGIIIATGTQRKKLLVDGETEFLGRGVSYCAICDGPLFKGRTTAVIGSGDEAFEDALYLSNLSKNVILITGQKDVEAAKTLIDKCNEKENIKILKAKVKSIRGDTHVKSIAITDLETSKDEEFPVDGVFICTGSVPTTNLIKKAGITVDERGCIKVDRRQATNIEGVFAAGDCTCGGMQIATAVGEGAMAAMQAYRFLRTLKR